jgi:hypothetical protein
VRILFRTVFDVIGVQGDSVDKFEHMIRCHHMANCTASELQRANKEVASLTCRFISIMCATARGVSAVTRCRTVLLDKATAARQAEIVGRTSTNMNGAGYYAFCGVCEKPAVPLKPQKRNHVSRQVKPHANYTQLSERRGNAPLEVGDRHTSVGFVATLFVENSISGSHGHWIGTYTCSANSTPACVYTEISAVDCRGAIFTNAGVSVQICERCGGFTRHHAASKWFGLARVCDPCDIEPPKTSCAVCGVSYFPSVQTDGITLTCVRCSSACRRCHTAMPIDYTASVAGRAAVCGACAAACVKCRKPVGWLVRHRVPGQAICDECHGTCTVCKKFHRRPKDPGGPDQEPCARCVRRAQLVDRHAVITGKRTPGHGLSSRPRVHTRPQGGDEIGDVAKLVRLIRKGCRGDNE